MVSVFRHSRARRSIILDRLQLSEIKLDLARGYE